jgi:hypothetical protein
VARVRGTEHHSRPHFHIVHPDWDCSVDIETGEFIEGESNPTRTEKEQIEVYRVEHIDLLREIWRTKHVAED